MATFFTSDTHFGHANIIKPCNRPFATVEEMDQAILDRINAKVQTNDVLYHLGDFSFRGGDPARYRERLHCKNVILIMGNHDPSYADGSPRPEFASLFSAVHALTQLKVEIATCASQRIVLCHYAMKVWDRSHHGTWHLYGHSHGSLPDDPNALSWDVGVDVNNFEPLSVADITAIMSRKTFLPIDHHGRDKSLRDG